MKHRRAMTMIELLVIMSASTVLLSLTGTLMHRAMQIQMKSRGHAGVERTALRLATQFRHDVHAARSAVVGNADQLDSEFLRLELDGGRLAEYTRLAGGVQRVESGGEKQAWREQFDFPAISELSIAEETSPRRLILTLIARLDEKSLSENKVSVNIPPVSLRVEAAVGRSLRFENAPGEEASE